MVTVMSAVSRSEPRPQHPKQPTLRLTSTRSSLYTARGHRRSPARLMCRFGWFLHDGLHAHRAWQGWRRDEATR
jgi:hypothetical protein